ncbi:uncharacterized protein LOC119092579 [Pollicipes pollicipes]|uniref:uncharacterized protein LOC119092579 n=1 Tax=Pollicipes pollicipes TaxID=41117 RepID=UPI001884A83B|nr:uncharacterized protein LOC119092579 [Pollicipes pollicipes]
MRRVRRLTLLAGATLLTATGLLLRSAGDQQDDGLAAGALPSAAVPLTGCTCQRPLPSGARRVVSTCAGFATLRGPDQWVVSFSWFGGVDGAYFAGIAANAARMTRVYPGWVMRVYYSDPDGLLLPSLCPLACRYTHLDFCEVSGAAQLASQPGVLWRFLPLTDPAVERFISRDLDSLIGQRERDAVQEWIESGKTIHVIRDHPLHAVSILAGAWGAWNKRSDIYRPFHERLVADSDVEHKAFRWGEDQVRLEGLVYRPAAAAGDVLEHDSYFCGQFGAFRPFPSRRDLGTFPHFVGDRVLLRDFERERVTREDWLFYIRKCPPKCRPPQHVDWLWC